MQVQDALASGCARGRMGAVSFVQRFGSIGSGEEDTVSDVIVGNTFGHYEEHGGWIREALGR